MSDRHMASKPSAAFSLQAEDKNPRRKNGAEDLLHRNRRPLQRLTGALQGTRWTLMALTAVNRRAEKRKAIGRYVAAGMFTLYGTQIEPEEKQERLHQKSLRSFPVLRIIK